MLKFKDGKFKILIFGDLHEGLDYAESLKFKDMQKLMNASLDECKPDLCVLMGDNGTTGELSNDKESYEKMMRAIVKPITDRNIPVAAILGNHEHDNGCEDEAVKICGNIEGFIMRNDFPPEISGNANFRELIYSSDGEKPLFCLWFLDSNNLCDDQNVSHYDYVHSDQIKQFEIECEKLRELNGGKPMPSFIFQHTPVPEEYLLLRKAHFWELPVAVRGHNKREKEFFVKGKNCKGYLGEGPCSPDFNNGQFASWKKVGGIKAAFFGHDHLNDFSGKVDGIYLAQHKTAGFRAYTDGCHSMVRLVTLDENDPESFKDEVRYFKSFGLKSESLGPVMRNFTDRQSRNIKISLAAAGAAAVITTAAILLKNN